MDDSKPHVALVTGGSRGIGRAVSLELARAGAAVFVAARSTAGCAEVVSAIEAEGGSAWPLEMNVASRASVDAAIARAAELCASIGPITWLVNNAGIADSAPIKRSAEPHERMLQINFHGSRRLVEGLLPGMEEAGYGRVVSVASSAGLRGYAYVTAYCASKFAMVGYTLACADELKEKGKDVTFNAVCPHYVDTPMLADAIAKHRQKKGSSEEEARRFFASENPGKRLVTAEEVAREVRTCLEGDFTGATLELDGSDGANIDYPNERLS